MPNLILIIFVLLLNDGFNVLICIIIIWNKKNDLLFYLVQSTQYYTSFEGSYGLHVQSLLL